MLLALSFALPLQQLQVWDDAWQPETVVLLQLKRLEQLHYVLILPAVELSQHCTTSGKIQVVRPLEVRRLPPCTAHC